MAWSYSGNPASSDKDQVRFLISDTDENAQLIQDEEINWALTEYSTCAAAASVIALSIAAQYARKVDFTVSKDLRVSYKNQADFYSKLANDLTERASFILSTPYAGGISIADKESYEDDTDRVTPAFTKDDFMDDTSESSYITDSGD